jgi:two-component system, oxyanion-binding sensor
MTTNVITAGFMPLLDSAILIAAMEMGFAETEGVDLRLVKERSWANIRDRIAVEHFDMAHMLAPMPIAANLGLTPQALTLMAPFALGLGGNAVTVSTALWRKMEQFGEAAVGDPAKVGRALQQVVKAQGTQGYTALKFAVVHPYSGHNYELRYWLAACGINPDKDIEIVVVPPPLMSNALRDGTIDGFCVGEPWNSVAVNAGVGRIITVKSAIWRSSPEKVLGVRLNWAKANSEKLNALLRSLFRAAEWCGNPQNHQMLADVLAKESYIGVPALTILKGLTGNLDLADTPQFKTSQSVVNFFDPVDRAATFPWQSHALWFYSQMVRWGQIPHSQANVEIAKNSYRPDIYRLALKPLGVTLPGANAKVEGALLSPAAFGTTQGNLVLGPDGFFDGMTFDPDNIDEYILSQT